MRRKWITPFDLYGSLMWWNRQQAKSGNPEASGKNKIRLVRDGVCNGAGNPLLSTTGTSIPEGWTSEFEDQIQEREGYGGRRLNGNVFPQYGMLSRSKVRKAPHR